MGGGGNKGVDGGVLKPGKGARNSGADVDSRQAEYIEVHLSIDLKLDFSC